MNGTAVKEAREALGLTQSDLARACGVRPSYISMIESGDRTGLFLLTKLAEVLKVDPAALLNMRDTPDLAPATA